MLNFNLDEKIDMDSFGICLPSFLLSITLREKKQSTYVMVMMEEYLLFMCVFLSTCTSDLLLSESGGFLLCHIISPSSSMSTCVRKKQFTKLVHVYMVNLHDDIMLLIELPHQ